MKLKSLTACAALVVGLAVALPMTSASAATVRYEAETAPAVCDGTIDSNHAGFSGGGFCNGRNAVGAAAQFTVDASSGSATLAVRFANGGTAARLASLIVNGSTVQTVTFEATGAWANWSTKTLTVPLASGGNTVRFNPTSAEGLPNIDYLEVTQDDGPALYVSPSGNDGNPGTLSQPLRTVQPAVDRAQPGTTIYLRGGTYAPSTNIRLLKNGTASQPITLRNHNNERVIIDGENMPHTPAPVGGSIPRSERGALHIQGNYWRITGLEIINGPYGVFGLDTNNNVFERLVTRDNYESGFHLQGASSRNEIINLDSYGNRDPRKNGESADGIAIKEGSGTGNVIRGARLWNNSDDGLDFWLFSSPVTVESSLAWGNGVNRWNLPNYTGDGNGFKLGGGPGDTDPPAAHVVRNSMAWDHPAHGFDDNGNPGSLTIERSTAWRNRGTGFNFPTSSSTLTRNLSADNQNNARLGSRATGSNNSWNLGGTWSFVSTDPSGLTGPRRADGSLPSSTFLRSSNGADIGARF